MSIHSREPQETKNQRFHQKYMDKGTKQFKKLVYDFKKQVMTGQKTSQQATEDFEDLTRNWYGFIGQWADRAKNTATGQRRQPFQPDVYSQSDAKHSQGTLASGSIRGSLTGGMQNLTLGSGKSGFEVLLDAAVEASKDPARLDILSKAGAKATPLSEQRTSTLNQLVDAVDAAAAAEALGSRRSSQEELRQTGEETRPTDSSSPGLRRNPTRDSRQKKRRASSPSSSDHSSVPANYSGGSDMDTRQGTKRKAKKAKSLRSLAPSQRSGGPATAKPWRKQPPENAWEELQRLVYMEYPTASNKGLSKARSLTRTWYREHYTDEWNAFDTHNRQDPKLKKDDGARNKRNNQERTNAVRDLLKAMQVDDLPESLIDMIKESSDSE